MLVAFRADANARSGLGHLRRCISVAQALARVGATSVFLCRRSDVPVSTIVGDAGFELRWVEGDAGAQPQEADADASVSALAGLSPDWVVVDDYGLDASWHRRVVASLKCQMAAVDDLADRPLDVELLIDHNLAPAGDQARRYTRVLESMRTRRLFGPRFAMLGPAFEALPAFVVRAQVSRIGIFLGGTDPTGHSTVAMRACREVGFEGTIEVVTTCGNPAIDVLHTAVAADPDARLMVDLPDLRDFNARCDLVIGAGGGATWERCAVGVPTLTLCLVDNQRAVVPTLVETGATVSTDDNSVHGIGHALRPLLADVGVRASLSRRCRELVDGHGTQRIAVTMAAAAGLTLAPATLDHAGAMWAWRNHPRIRAVSRQSAAIPFQDHYAWLEGTLGRPGRHLWVAMTGIRPVGVIRFDETPEPGHAEVSLYLDPELQGLGLGSQLLSAGEAQLRQCATIASIDAEVLSGNEASQALFLSAGYRRVDATRYLKTFPA